MKETLVSIIKQSMDKCTTEQFWVVATTIGINSYIIGNFPSYRQVIHYILAFSTLLTCYSIFLIIHRARAHIKCAYMLYRLIEPSTDVDKEVKDLFKSSGKVSPSDFTGAGFYAVVVLSSYIALLMRIFNVYLSGLNLTPLVGIFKSV
jgi:hypothetical protein